MITQTNTPETIEVDVEALERVAREAYPQARWKFVPGHIEEGEPAVRHADEGWIIATTPSDVGARFIATFDPPTVLSLLDRLSKAEGELERLSALINAPELHNFAQGVVVEAAHQRERWGSEHDAGKEPQDWFWLLGWLAGKAVKAAQSGDRDKALHHTISSAAVLANWHAALSGANASMRPGINPEERGYEHV